MVSERTVQTITITQKNGREIEQTKIIPDIVKHCKITLLEICTICRLNKHKIISPLNELKLKVKREACN